MVLLPSWSWLLHRAHRFELKGAIDEAYERNPHGPYFGSAWRSAIGLIFCIGPRQSDVGARQCTTLGETMSKAARSNTDQWPLWMKRVQYILLAVGVFATLVLPIRLLDMASDARTDGKLALAEQYSTWSSSLVILGPSFFTTSLLAMGSKLPLRARVVIGLLAFCLAVYIYYQLGRIGEEFHIPVILGIAGVLYCLVADIFTPNSAYAENEKGMPTKVVSFVIRMVLFLAGVFVLQYLTPNKVGTAPAFVDSGS